MTHRKRHIVCKTHAGLCNRIKCFLSTSRLAQHDGREVKVYWPINHKCGGSFSSLFVSDVQVVEKPENGTVYNRNDLVDLSNNNILIINTWRFAISIEEWHRGVREIDFLYDKNKIDAEVRKALQSVICGLQFNEKINDFVSTFVNRFFHNYMIGVHMRRTDHVIAKKCSPDAAFYHAIQNALKKNNKAQLFLSTDCAATENMMKKQFPDRCLTIGKSFGARKHRYSVEEALAELLLLSKTNKIIGSYASTFTELAWWLSGFKQIEIAVNESVVNKISFDDHISI